MHTLLVTFKQLLIWLLPFAGLHFYLSAYYSQSLPELTIWWVNNFNLTLNNLVKLLAFTVLFILFSIHFNSLMNSLYLRIFGKKKSQVFLGHLAKSTAMYYRANDKNKTVYSEHDPDNEFNYSFDDVNRLKSFIKVPFTENTKVTSRKHFHPYSIITRSMLAVFFLMPLLASIHAIALPAYNPDVNNGTTLTGSAIASFDQVLSYLNLNLFYMAVTFFLSLALAIYFSNRQVQEDPGKQVEPLPENIAAGNTVTGKPLIITKTTIEKYDEYSQLNTHVDTGFRRVSFEFSNEFNPPVFVTLKFDGKKYPGLEDQIKADIKSQKTMELKLTGKLRLKVISDEEDPGKKKEQRSE